MKVRVHLAQLARVGSTRVIPESVSVTFTANGEEDAQFVPVGPLPGRRIPVIRLTIESLEPGAIPFELNDECVLTLEPIARR